MKRSDPDTDSENSDVEWEPQEPVKRPCIKPGRDSSAQPEVKHTHAKARIKAIRDDLLAMVTADIDSDVGSDVDVDMVVPRASSSSSAIEVPATDTGSDASSASSAHVDAVMKRQRKNERRQVTRKVPGPELKSDETDLMLMEQARAHMPTVAPIGSLLWLYPHMRTSQTRPSAVTTADGKVIVPPPALDQERPNPPISKVLQDHLMNTVRPHYSAPGTTHEDIVKQLRNHEAFLPLLSADYESALLAEAGTHPVRMESGRVDSYKFPACCRGNECVGMTYRLHGFTAQCPGVILTALMMPAEYQLFMETHTAPLQQRCCILCARAHLASFILTLRANQERLPLVDRSFSCQLYRSACNSPGGYKPSCMLLPSSKRFEGIFDPVVGFFVSKLRAVQDPAQGGRWVIDQSAMVFTERPQLMPTVAEPIKVASTADAATASP